MAFCATAKPTTVWVLTKYIPTYLWIKYNSVNSFIYYNFSNQYSKLIFNVYTFANIVVVLL